jgi:hypothetical protein
MPNTPWVLPDTLIERAICAANKRSSDFVAFSAEHPELDMFGGPDPAPGWPLPEPGENGWVADANGRWFGPDEYFEPIWQVLAGCGAVTPTPSFPMTNSVFLETPEIILSRALNAGFVPDDEVGWRQIAAVTPARPNSPIKREKVSH